MSWSLQLAAVAASFLQLLIDPSNANVTSSLLVLASSTVTLQYLRLSRGFRDAPLSSFALLGLCITTQWGALVFQSAAWTSVSQNLNDPIRTFSLLGAYQAVAVVAHLIYRNVRVFVALREMVSNKVLAPLGVFEIPSAAALWAMGTLGVATSYLTNTTFDQNVGDKLLAGGNFLLVAPFLIPLLHRRFGDAYCNGRLNSAALLGYLVVVVGIGMVTTGRGMTFSGAMTALLIYFLFQLDDGRPVRLTTVAKLAAMGLCGIVLLHWMADLATAMQIGRGYRDRNHTQWDVLDVTVEALLDPSKIQAYQEKRETETAFSLYDEKYFANPIIARVVETKFHDNMFYFTRELRFEDSENAKKLVADKLWALLPTPVLRWLKIPVEKGELQFSTGDFWADLRFGIGFGAFVTGSMFADGQAIFGTWFALVYLLICLLFFLAWDTLARRGGPGFMSQISVVGLLMSLRLFQYGITADSFPSLLSFPLRALPQNILIYVVTLWFLQLFSAPFTQKDPGTAAAVLHRTRVR